MTLNRILIFLIFCAMFTSLTACGDRDSRAATESADSGADIAAANTSEASGTSEPTDAPAPIAGGTPLIVYFTANENAEPDAISSASIVSVDGTEKGHVRALADMIAAETGGDLFALTTETRYPADRDGVIEQAADEQDKGFHPVLETQLENLDAYDTVFVGYPTWWYDMPMALYSFFEEYDLSGKTIIPFNTHNGSRFSGTIDTIQQLEPDADVVTGGFTVSEQRVADAAEDATAWLDGLG